MENLNFEKCDYSILILQLNLIQKLTQFIFIYFHLI